MKEPAHFTIGVDFEELASPLDIGFADDQNSQASSVCLSFLPFG